ncbi:hypothetical protein HMPREF3218_0202164 [Prevotella bivia]|nr:hypothetical protein HMPREF3218_0202164 [Prevotella bivia]
MAFALFATTIMRPFFDCQSSGEVYKPVENEEDAPLQVIRQRIMHSFLSLVEKPH